MANKPKTAPQPSDVSSDLDELESLLQRAEHFESAGLIQKLRLDGLAIIERIRGAI